LLATADAYGGELRLGLAHLDRVRGNIAEQVDSHRGLVSLLESGDVEAAAAELARHLAAAEVSLRDAIGHGTIEP
jgi:DNA-binding GntR family transcriptional regulator